MKPVYPLLAKSDRLPVILQDNRCICYLDCPGGTWSCEAELVMFGREAAEEGMKYVRRTSSNPEPHDFLLVIKAVVTAALGERDTALEGVIAGAYLAHNMCLARQSYLPYGATAADQAFIQSLISPEARENIRHVVDLLQQRGATVSATPREES